MPLTEDKEQEILFQYLDLKHITAFAIPNGGRRNPAEAAHMKRCGVKAGVPDIFIPIARNGHNGLFIEMKRVKGGVVSEHQHEWLERLRSLGYRAEVCRGADEAIRLIEEELG